MKILVTVICTAFLFCSCECDSPDETATETDAKIITADTTSTDTLETEKRSVPAFPKDDEGTKKMDEIVNRAKKQKL